MSVQGGGSIPSRGIRCVAPFKRDFRRGPLSGGFLLALRFPPPSKLKRILISSIIGSSKGGFRSRDVRKRAEKLLNMNEEINDWKMNPN
jgi:hypothetical protein